MIDIRTLWKVAKRYLDYRRGKRLPLICCWLITNRCILSCEGCFYFDRVNHDKDRLDSAQAFKVLDRMIEIDLPVLYVAGGEPLMRKDLFQLMAKAKQHNIFTVLYTNGILIDEQNAPLIDMFFDLAFISIDGFETQHEILRGKGSYKPAIKGLKELLKIRQKSKVGINYVITRHNGDITCDFLDSIENLKLDRLKIHPHYFPDHRPTESQIRPIVEKLNAIKEDKPDYLIGGRNYFFSWPELISKGEGTPCDELDNFINVGIMPDGDVSACSSFYAPVGNLLENSFDEILSKPLDTNLAKAANCSGCYRYDAPVIRYVFETPLLKLKPARIWDFFKG